MACMPGMQWSDRQPGQVLQALRTGGEVQMIRNIEERKDCPMRHENGNCLVIGGFCIDGVSDEICHGLHEAYDKGYRDGRNEMIDYYNILEGGKWE